MDLYIVRHGIAFEQDPSRWSDDRLRPLTPEGEDRFRKVAKGLAKIVSAVDVVLASPFVRAWRTAEILAEEAGWPEPVACDALQAERPVSEAVAEMLAHAHRDAVALVGHEPHLGDLISFLLTGGNAVGITLKKGGAAMVSFDGAPAAAAGTLRWFIPPKVSRSLR